jgi:hypothetical protein
MKIRIASEIVIAVALHFDIDTPVSTVDGKDSTDVDSSAAPTSRKLEYEYRVSIDGLSDASKCVVSS